MNLNKKALEKASRELLVDSVHCRCAPSTSAPPCWYCKDRTEDVITAYLEAMVVTTREELDALPVGVVVIDHVKEVAQKMSRLGWSFTGLHLPCTSGDIALPARVIYTPEETE